MKAIAWALLVACATNSAAEQPATRSIPAGVMVDAEGKKMGHFSPRDESSGLLLVNLGGHLVYLGAWYRRDGSGKFEAFGPFDTRVYYAGPDCTGLAYVESAMTPPLQRGAPDGSQVDVFISTGAQVNVPHLSIRYARTSCENTSNGNPMNLFPVSDVLQLESFFKPPYSLR